MASRQRHGERGQAPESEGPRADGGQAESSPELEALLTLGNMALTERMAPGGGPADAIAQVGVALRVAPRDPAWSERMVGIVERSDLSAERKDALTERLRWDQVAADDVSRAVAAAFGRDDPEVRAVAIAAVESGGGELVDRLAARIAERHGAVDAPAAAADLVRALTLVRPWWDEEEDESIGAPGDYAAESGG